MSGTCLYREHTPSGLIQVWQDGDRRSLWFDDVILQSEIDLNDPAVLPNPANRAMLAHLMFGQQPGRVLLAGCGGGGIARWFNARSPQTRGDAVELSPEVAAVARSYFDFPPPPRWQMHVDDVRPFVARHQGEYDFILVDLEEQQYSPDWVSSEAFLTACREALSEQGVLTINLIPRHAEHFTGALATIREVFARRTLCLPVAGHDNQLVIAFRQTPELAAIEQLGDTAQHWGLPLAQHWQAIKAANPAGSGIL